MIDCAIHFYQVILNRAIHLHKKRQGRGEDDIKSTIENQVGHGGVPDQRKLIGSLGLPLTKDISQFYRG